MTKHKARKRLVRPRAATTGESYTAALRQLLASKESAVTTENTPVSCCALCAARAGPATSFVFAGVTLCVECHERLRSAVRTHLEPEAARAGRPLEYFLTALAFARHDDAWVVHLHTFQPGLVIGRQGVTASNIRTALVEVTGDNRLRLNIAQHDFNGSCTRTSD